ncbi:MAG: hypothetical protein KGV44_01400 [Flavobacteriaceae bacterium]|nr:hypothetical protein [Flavobacteriaceae bacterium]
MLRKNPKYTKQDLIMILGKADGTIKEHLSSLQKRVIERVGGRKLGYWKVNININRQEYNMNITTENINTIIQKGESQFVEFKSTFQKKKCD